VTRGKNGGPAPGARGDGDSELEWRDRLRDPQERYRALIERIPAVVYIDRPDRVGLYVSPQVEAMTGVTEEAWLAGVDGWLDAVHPDDKQRVRAIFLRPDRRSTTAEYRVVLRDGRIRWVHDDTVGVYDEQGRLEMWHGVVVDVTERVEAEEALRRSEERRRAVMEAMIRGEDHQRQRIAGELHDDTIQVMTAALLAIDQLTASLRRGDVDAARRTAGRARDSLSAAIERARRLTFELRPQVLDAQGLAGAVRALARQAGREAGFRVAVRVEVDRHSHHVETLVYRTVAEALSNARRHSGASRVTVRLSERDGWLAGSVADDGRGFDAAAATRRTGVSLHFGLDGAAERLRLAGGEFRVDSAPGGGTRVSFRMPTG
jgi:PAS domain S-box-containing protein